MSLKVADARLATADEWDHIWENCIFATYYHSREWAEMWHKYSQGRMRPDAEIITFSDGKSVLLPLSSRRILRGLFKQYISSPAGTFGGWLSINELSESHGRLLYEYIMSHYGNLTWRLNPYNPLEAGLNIKGVEKDETQALNLECGFEAIYKGWTKGHASAATKARKAGVEISEATTLQDWLDYYAIYEDSLKRWGESASSHYDWSLFQYMFDLSSFNIKLWLATFDAQIVAGALCFYARKHVGYWHGAASANYFNLRPVNLLMYEVIKESCEHDYKWFDFNPSGGHQGVRAFKKSFGAEELGCPVVNRNDKTTRLVRGILFQAKDKMSWIR